jgi:hypothetical protein
MAKAAVIISDYMRYQDIKALQWYSRLSLFTFFLLAFLLWCRGPISAMNDSRDFAILYLSSTSWAKGLDPYDQELYYANWVKADAPPDKMPDKNLVPSVYPIFSLPLIAPLTFLSWPNAKILWIFLNSFAFFSLLASLLIMSKLSLRDWRAISLVSACLILYPIHVTITLGQPIILVMVCGLGSIMAANSKRHLCSAILLATSLCLKPQLGIVFFCYLIILRQWRILGFCSGIILVIVIAGILRLGSDNLSWLDSWKKNLTTAFSVGGPNDPTMKNQYRYQLLNLQFPLSMLIHKKNVVETLAISIVVLEMIILLKYVKVKNNFDELLTLGLISIISLFPVYHRYYDSAILVLLLTIIFMMIIGEYHRFSWILIWLSIPFIIPWQELITVGWNYGFINHLVTISWWWNILLPLHVYCLLIMSFILLYIIIIKNSAFKAKAG